MSKSSSEPLPGSQELYLSLSASEVVSPKSSEFPLRVTSRRQARAQQRAKTWAQSYSSDQSSPHLSGCLQVSASVTVWTLNPGWRNCGASLSWLLWATFFACFIAVPACFFHPWHWSLTSAIRWLSMVLLCEVIIFLPARLLPQGPSVPLCPTEPASWWLRTYKLITSKQQQWVLGDGKFFKCLRQNSARDIFRHRWIQNALFLGKLLDGCTPPKGESK